MIGGTGVPPIWAKVVEVLSVRNSQATKRIVSERNANQRLVLSGDAWFGSMGCIGWFML